MGLKSSRLKSLGLKDPGLKSSGLICPSTEHSKTHKVEVSELLIAVNNVKKNFNLLFLILVSMWTEFMRPQSFVLSKYITIFRARGEFFCPRSEIQCLTHIDDLKIDALFWTHPLTRR